MTAPTGDAQLVLPGIRTLLGSLNASDARVAEVVVNRPADVIHMSVKDLAELAGTAQSTVIRACKAMGFKGFQDLKIRIAQEVALGGPLATPFEELGGETAGPVDVLRGVVDGAMRSLSEAPVTIEGAAFEQAVDALAAAQRILVLGVGTSWAPAQDAAYRFTMIGLPAHAPVDIRGQLLAARLLRPGDACLVLSHTGASQETLAAAEAAQAAGSTIIAITSFAGSALTAHADVVLLAGGHDLGFRLEAMLSRLVHLAIVDALYVAIARKLPEISRPALDAMAAVTATHTI